MTREPHPNDALREPFAPEQIGKLPRVTCGACRNAPSKNCDKHAKRECGVCGNWISSAHMHLDYVGHAQVTDRLLSVDPDWDWEPMGHDADGLPKFDSDGGLWIYLTVNGKSKKGYGNAEGKRGGDAKKEIIGDALRNAGMRFGIALHLWAKGDLAPGGHDYADATPAPAKPLAAVPDQPEPEPSGRDWLAEAALITDAEVLKALGNECAAFKEFVGPVATGMHARMNELRRPTG